MLLRSLKHPSLESDPLEKGNTQSAEDGLGFQIKDAKAHGNSRRIKNGSITNNDLQDSKASWNALNLFWSPRIPSWQGSRCMELPWNRSVYSYSEYSIIFPMIVWLCHSTTKTDSKNEMQLHDIAHVAVAPQCQAEYCTQNNTDWHRLEAPLIPGFAEGRWCVGPRLPRP